jgi:hypothetical protein
MNPKNIINKEIQNQLQNVPIIVLPANPNRAAVPQVSRREYVKTFTSSFVI